jgi:hypothetical protein
MSMCPVCDAPMNQPCETCVDSMAMILSLKLGPEPEARCANVVEQTQKLINICSGEDVCLS